MVIREYKEDDEKKWLYCRVLSFLDTSYYDDVMTRRIKYENESICLVAEEDENIIGFIDVEIEKEPKTLCAASSKLGAVIWNLAVLPEYRHKHVASDLWQEARKRLFDKEISYCEVWTQQDEAANYWYQSQGFKNIEKHNWLRCFIEPQKAEYFLNHQKIGKIYGIDEWIIKADCSRRKELSEYCYRIEEVRLYTIELE